MDPLPESMNSHCGPFSAPCPCPSVPFSAPFQRSQTPCPSVCGAAERIRAESALVTRCRRMVAVRCDSPYAYRARVESSRCGTPTTDRAPRGAHVVTPGDDYGFPFARWTCLVESSLKSFLLRQASPPPSPKSDN
eukprot:7387906-Prymnesium_polylepis.1